LTNKGWLFIQKRLELCETCSRDIFASALSLLSLIESHKSVEEAESARVLALLGTVYLPLSLTAGILSMGRTFTPGQGQFWIFFVIAGLLMILNLGATYMPMMRDFLYWAVRRGGTGATGGVKRVPTFVEECQETV
jgi:Mg2+ and Co2+ transporter CorA